MASATSGVGLPSDAGRTAQQSSFGRFRAFGRQLEARDARIVPGDSAKAAYGFEDEITVRCLAHHGPRISIYDATRKSTARIQSASCFLICLQKVCPPRNEEA